MPNSFYVRTFDVLPGSRVGSQALEDQLELVEQGFDKLPSPQAVSAGQGNYAVAGGSAGVYTVAMSANVTTLNDGLTVQVKIPAALANPTTTPTINVNSLGAKTITLQDGTAVSIGDMTGILTLAYNATLDKFTHVAGAGLAAGHAAAASAAASAASANDSADSAAAALASEGAASASASAASGSAVAAAGSASEALASAIASAASAAASEGAMMTASERTSNTILGQLDRGNLIALNGAFTQTFDAAATLGNGWFCYLRNTGNGDITLDPNASELIDGAATLVLKPGFIILLTCSGTAFTPVTLKARSYPNVAEYTASSTFTVPSDTYVIRPYAFGAGAAGTTSASGGGGGCAYGDVAVTPGQSVTVTISSGVATVVVGGVTLLTANAASGTTAGTASKHASVTNGGAYSGGAGGSGTNKGGASSGSPLGAGVGGANGGGSGWGGSGNANSGTGGGGGGAGGAATAFIAGPGLVVPSTDPLLYGLDGSLGSTGGNAVGSGVAGAPGAGGAGLGHLKGGAGGFGGGGGASIVAGGPGGIGGFGGGGGGVLGAGNGGGAGGYGGGGGAGSSAGGAGGAAVIRIYY